MGWDCGVVGCCVGLARQPVGEVGKRVKRRRGRGRGRGEGCVWRGVST